MITRFRMATGMTTDVYPRENCIAPDMYRIVCSMNHAYKRWREGVSWSGTVAMIDLRLPTATP